MSVGTQGVTWDRRRANRFGAPFSGDRRRADSAVGRFEAYLDMKLGELERSAAVIAGEVSVDAIDLRAGADVDALDADKFDRLTERIPRALEEIAEEISSLRDELGVAHRS
jgi:hypothetical protein